MVRKKNGVVQQRLCDLWSTYYLSCITELQIITCSQINLLWNYGFYKKSSFSFFKTGLEIILIKFYLPLVGKIVDRLARFT